MGNAQRKEVGQLIALDEQIVKPPIYDLHEAVCRLGRIEDAHILIQHPLVSRLHAWIERNGPRYVLIDAGSVNGTFVNRSRITTPRLLLHDDEIGLGATRPCLRFIDPDPTGIAPRQLRYDERAMVFYLGDYQVKLTPTQHKLLLFFYQHAGEVCSHERCAQMLWGRDYEPGSDAGRLEQQIAGLRAALRAADADAASELLLNRRGLGYLLNLSD